MSHQDKERRTTCRWTQMRLMPYVDGELTAREAGFVTAHLESCPSCRDAHEAIVDGQARLQAIFGEDGPAEDFGGAADNAYSAAAADTGALSPDFTARVMGEIRRRQSGLEGSEARTGQARSMRGRGNPSSWVAWARPLAAASMVATLLLGSYTALTMDARAYARLMAYQQRTAAEIRDDLWTVARKTGLEGIIARYLSQVETPDQ